MNKIVRFNENENKWFNTYEWIAENKRINKVEWMNETE